MVFLYRMVNTKLLISVKKISSFLLITKRCISLKQESGPLIYPIFLNHEYAHLYQSCIL